MSWKIVPFESLKGKTFKNIIINDSRTNISFITEDNEWYTLNHKQECCESVYLEDVDNDINELIGSKILLAELRTNTSDIHKGERDFDTYSSRTWSFYTIGNINTTCVIRWFGASNGCYSEEAELKKFVNNKEESVDQIKQYIKQIPHFNLIENTLVNKFLELISEIPFPINNWYINNDPKSNTIKKLFFTFENPKTDVLKYELTNVNDQIKITEHLVFDNCNMASTATDMERPNLETIKKFLFECGEFK